MLYNLPCPHKRLHVIYYQPKWLMGYAKMRTSSQEYSLLDLDLWVSSDTIVGFFKYDFLLVISAFGMRII